MENPLHTTTFVTLFTVGVGLTVIVKCWKKYYYLKDTGHLKARLNQLLKNKYIIQYSTYCSTLPILCEECYMFNPLKGQCYVQPFKGTVPRDRKQKKLGAMKHSRDHEKLTVFHCCGKTNVDVVIK